MTSSSNLKNLLLRYLLQQMGEAERAEIDFRLIADEDFADEFQGAQHDLLDDFAADRLPQEEAVRVRQAIEVNDAFARAAQMAVAFRLASRHPGPAAKPVTRFRLPYWAMAACALLIAAGVAGGVAWRHRMAIRESRPATASTEKMDAAPKAPAVPNITADSQAKQPDQQGRQAQPILVATLVLPEGTRSGTAIPLRLQPGTQKIRVEWPVPSDVEDKARLTLAVLQESKQIEFLSEVMPRHKVGSVPVAQFLIPAARVPSGRYLFRITQSPASSNDPPLTELEVEIGSAS